MAGKPELSASAGVQNVVVYVSNDNFAQAYAVSQHNVPPNLTPNSNGPIQNGTYTNPTHSMAPMVGSTKCYNKSNVLKPADYPNNQILNGAVHQQQQQSYFTEVLSQNSYPQPLLNNINYQSNAAIDPVKNYNIGNGDVLSGERQAGPGRPELRECDREGSYVDSSFVTVMGAECPSQSVRCDSVRSETAESSCSSSSSADEGIVVVQNPAPEMVVYDSSVSVRPGGVVLAVGPQQTPSPLVGSSIHSHQGSFVSVPFGWKRLSNNGNIIYISPSNTALNSPEQIKEYLLSSGTCKCGLECHFKYDNIFNFDPKVASKPWTFPPDTSVGDLTKLCNHKRKMIGMNSLDCKQMDPNLKLGKDYNIKRKKRKMEMSYGSGVSVSQMLAHREKLAMGQQHNFIKDNASSQQIWSMQQHQQQLANNRLQGYPDNIQLTRYSTQDINENGMISDSTINNNDMSNHNQQQMLSNISQQNELPNTHRQVINNNPNVHIQNQHLITPNGQIISLQKGTSPIVQNTQNMMGNVLVNNSNMPMMAGQKFNQPMSNISHGQMQPQQRIYVNGQPSEPSGPGRPVQMIPMGIDNQRPIDVNHRISQQPQPFYSNQQQPCPQMSQYDPTKNIRQSHPPNNQMINGFRPHIMNHQGRIMQQHMMISSGQQKVQWQNRPQAPPQQPPQNHLPIPNVYERVPPLPQHSGSPLMWNEEVKKKKVKLNKGSKNRAYGLDQTAQAACPNIDIRQIPNDNNRAVILNQIPTVNQNTSGPSFMEDPSGYLAQQTALLNHTINRQTGANSCAGYVCNSPSSSIHPTHNPNVISLNNSHTNEVPLPSNVVMQMKQNQNVPQKITHQNLIKNQQQQQIPNSMMQQQQYNQVITQGVPDSSAVNDQIQQQHSQCQGCLADSMNSSQQYVIREHINNQGQKILQYSRPNSQPGTPSSSGGIEDVTSSSFSDKQSVQNSPDNRPIQGGTVSTSNVSPIDGLHSGPPTPNPHTPSSINSNPHTPNSYTPNPLTPTPQTPTSNHQILNQIQVSHEQQIQNEHHTQQIPNSQPFLVQRISDSNTGQNYIVYSSNNNNMQQIQMNHIKDGNSYSCKPEYYVNANIQQQDVHTSKGPFISGIVTTMASGRTVGSNTITSVLAGRANTATVSTNSPQNMNNPSPPSSIHSQNIMQTHPVTVNVSKSPLEMVQSVVSSIQVPHSQHSTSIPHSNAQISPTLVKSALPPGHILVSSGGQLIMANTGNCQTNVMPPPPPKLVTNQQAMPPVSASPMVTNVTAAVTQMIPAVAQQMLGQQTVLVNALPAPFVLQPGVTMTMDGVTVGQNMQLPQIVTGNVIQQQVQIESNDSRRGQNLLSPESRKKGKKRKIPPQTVAGMLQISAQQNTGMVMQQQSFPQQIQMAHSPQGITAGPVMQALTIVPSKNGGPAQIVMNGQTNLGTQQLITNSQPTQQINLLQPVNLINGGTGVVQNFPTIQQFIVPNLGGMVMNPDGTATLLQDTSNIGMQLQLQNVNGQNILTPVQNNSVFNGSQNIIAAGPAGMVIRAPNPTQGKIIQQQHSPGAQFLSPNGGQFVVNSGQFGGQLSPLVASVSPSQQVTFSSPAQQIRANTSIQPQQQEFIQCNQMGQTLMVPCTPANNLSASNSNQNTTYVQQNTTIVQQQTTMVSNNQQQQNQPNMQRTTTVNVDHNFLISSNDNKQMQSILVKDCPQNPGYRQSVSTQTATNQSQAVTTNTFCQTSTVSAGSPPDTTTHSPLALGGQSPPTVDTTTHSGSTDDGLSPAPSNCSTNFTDVSVQGRHQSMAMVHCISSSEPDSADLNTQGSDNECFRSQMKNDYGEISSGQMHYLPKKSTPTHFAYAESSTMVSGVHYFADQLKSDDSVVSSRNTEKRKSSDTYLVMETRQLHFDDEEESVQNIEKEKETTTFLIGDLVWGPTKGCPAWPGKIIHLDGEKATVKWYGNEKSSTIIQKNCLQTLSEGLEAHHRARKKIRTSRKLNSLLENAIHEAMAELDKDLKKNNNSPLTTSKSIISKKHDKIENSKPIVGRLRSSQK